MNEKNTETAACSGCGRDLQPGEEIVEIGRSDLYCISLCAVPMAVGQVLDLAPALA